MYDGEDGTWDNEYCAEYGFVATTEFREDGTCVFSCQANGNPPSLIYATYVVEANTIVIATATSAQPVVWRIEKLAASELNVAFDYPGENYTDRACYRSHSPRNGLLYSVLRLLRDGAAGCFSLLTRGRKRLLWSEIFFHVRRWQIRRSQG